MAEHKTAVTATGNVQSKEGYYQGYIVTQAVVGAVTIYDGTSNTGTVIDVIPANTAAGTRGILATPVKLDTGIHVAFAAPGGTVLFLHYA